MKTFIFNDVEYNDFESLGLAFIENIPKALECIQTTEFYKCACSSRVHKAKVRDAIYESYSLQSALSIIIYSFTERLIIGNREYSTVDQIVNDVDNNYFIKPFLRDKGLRKTLIAGIEDGIIKSNLMAVENYAEEAVAIEFFKQYNCFNPDLDITNDLNLIFENQEAYKQAFIMFNDDNFVLKLAYKYGLEKAMKVKKSETIVFDGLELIADESNETMVSNLLENAFYMGLGKTYNKFKYKSLRALDILDDISRKYKKAKKYANIKTHKDYFLTYLKFAELYQKNEIIAKKKYEEYAFTIPYCKTYVNLVILNDKQLTEYLVEDVDKINCYNLPKLGKKITNHKTYVKWNFVFVAISAVLYAITYIIPYITPAFNGVLGVCDYMLFGSFAGIIGLNVLMLLKTNKDEKRYNTLCKLTYYKKNFINLKKYEKEDYENLLSVEDKYSKKSDHNYVIIGSVINAFTAIMASLMTVMLLVILVPLFEEGFIGLSELLKSFYSPVNVKEPLDPSVLLLPAISLTVPFFVGFVRNKKTKWSCLCSMLFAFIVTVVLSIIL